MVQTRIPRSTAMSTDSPPDRHGSHSGQWGLAAISLGGLVILFFPMMTTLMLALLIGAWNINEVERRHIE